METIKALTLMFTVLFFLQGQAQPVTFQTDSKSKIEPLPLDVSYHKTTNLIFPFAIKSVDRGSADLLVQKAKEVENVLQLKAGLDSFQQTNLTVITSDGCLYSFILNYAAEPTTLNLELADKSKAEPIAIFSSLKDNQAKILNAAEYVSGKKAMFKRPKDSKFDVQVRLSGVYIKDDILYYQLQLENKSNISYGIEQLRFFIKDKKKSKRTASQELELKPVLIHGNASVIHEQSAQHLVVALDKFTIPDDKELIIQLIERNGGRHLRLKCGNKQIIDAQMM